MANYVENHKTVDLLKKYATRIKLTELTEAVNRGLMSQDEVSQAIKNKKLESLRSPVNFSHERKIMLAQCLENTNDRLAYMEATNPMAIGSYKRYALDITNAVTANLIAPEIVGVHTLEGRNGIVRYFNFNYGRDKGQTKAGQTFNSSLNMPANDPYYASNLVDGEAVVLDADGKYRFRWAPIKLNTFSLVLATADGNKTTYLADNFGTLKAADGTLGGTITPAGVLDGVTIPEGGSASATYRYDNEVVRDDGSHATSDNAYTSQGAGYVNVPTADVEIGTVPVFAEVYPMNATWSTMAEYDLMKETKMSMRDILQTQIIGELQREVDNKIITQLHNAADASHPITWSETPGVGVSPDAHYNGLRIEMNKASKKIRQASNKYSANYVVAGTQASADIECITGFKSANTNQVPGSRLVGELPGGMKLYETTALDEYDMFLGFKSNNTIESGAFYCPYMPVTSLGMIQTGDMRNREGFATAYAFTVVNSKLYQKGTIVPE